MNCPFCHDELGEHIYTEYLPYIGDSVTHKLVCLNKVCWVDGDFPRFVCWKSPKDVIIYQEYVLANFFIKADNNRTSISRLEGCILSGTISVPRPIWLNFTNNRRTLDKLKMCLIFS